MNNLVFGIDIIKGSVRSTTVPPRFALVRVVDSKVCSEEKNVSLQRLVRLINKERPSILAVDSIREISKDDFELCNFLSALSCDTKLVQVTGNGVKMQTLQSVAAKYNLKFDKTNPSEEAKVSALIASFGGGYEVSAFENNTSVTVSRGRSLGRGGWSQNRYARKVHGAVKVKAREVEDKLKEAGLFYTKTSKKAFGGESRVVFNVRAGRGDVFVSSSKSGDTAVKVEGRRKDKIEFVPLSKKPNYIIVGVDPGTTVGLAALDLDGNLVYLSSIRALAPNDAVSEIRGIGKPVMVATDKAEMPFGAEKIRRAFSAVAWTPKKDVAVKEKYETVAGYEFKDDHERDSLSAALMAYAALSSRFESVARRIPPGVDLDFVKVGLLRGQSIERILSDLSKDEKDEPVRKDDDDDVGISKDPKDERIKALENEVESLRKLARGLSDELEARNKAFSSLNKRLEYERDIKNTEILLCDEVEKRDKELERTKKALRKEERRCKNMRQRLERMKRYISLQAGEGCLAIKVLQQLSKEQIKITDDEMGICEDDILYILKIDGWGMSSINEIANAKIKAVVLPRITYQKAVEQHLIDAFRTAGVCVLSGAELSPRVKGKIGVVDEGLLVKALEDWKLAQEVYLKNKKTEEIHGMVSEYRVLRKREVAEHGIDPNTCDFKISGAKPQEAPAPKAKKQKKEQEEIKSSKPEAKAKRVETPAPVREPEPAKEEEPVKEKEKEKSVGDVLLGVLAEYREERKKENEQ